MGEPVQESGLRRWLVIALILIAATVAIADTWARLVASSVPAYVDFGLLALGAVATAGWLFIGKPARDTQTLTSVIAGAPPRADVADILLQGAVLGINRLGIDERHKDTLVRLVAAVVVGGLLVAWHVQLLSITAR
jgi:hypothetical protein